MEGSIHSIRRQNIIVPCQMLLGAVSFNRGSHRLPPFRQNGDGGPLFSLRGKSSSCFFPNWFLLVLIALTFIDLEVASVLPNQGMGTSEPEVYEWSEIPNSRYSLNASAVSDLIDGDAVLSSSNVQSKPSTQNGNPISNLLEKLFNGGTSDDNAVEAEKWGKTDGIRSSDSRNSFPRASFNLKGHYATFSLPSTNITEIPNLGGTINVMESSKEVVPFTSSPTNGRLIDRGQLHIVVLSRPSVIHSVRLATIKLDLESTFAGPRRKRTIALAGRKM